MPFQRESPRIGSARVSFVLACDFGGTSLRAALIDEAGDVFADCARPAPKDVGTAGMSQIDPDQWWTALIELVDELAVAAKTGFDEVVAIAICGVTSTQVFLDRDGKVLRPAFTWRDTRAQETLDGLLEALPRDHAEHASINAFHPLARLHWMKQHEPEKFAALGSVIEPKDYLNYRLTGRVVTDTVSSARLASAARSANGRSLLQELGVPDALPSRLEPLQIVGTVSANFDSALGRLAGCPVVCMTVDTWAAVVGLGAFRPRVGYNISGTTEVLGVISDFPAYAKGLVTVDWSNGLYQVGGPSQNGADTLSWLLELSVPDAVDANARERALDELLRKPRCPQPVLFMPYLQGERTPHWNTRLRGAFLGLERKHGLTDLAWAVLEGIAFLNRLVLEKAEAALGFSVEEIRFGGGASSNPVWCQIKADVCERPIAVGAAAQPGLLGCAIAAWTALERFDTLIEAQQKLVRIARHYTPRIGSRAAYRTLFERYLKADQLLPKLHQEMTLPGAFAGLPGTTDFEGRLGR